MTGTQSRAARRAESPRPALLAVAVLLSTLNLSAQETDRPYPEENDPPESFTGLLNDKAEIAQQQYGRLRGLREADNPHIPQGLLLRRLQVDPERSQVDTEALRLAHIARIEGREFTPQPGTGYFAPVPTEALTRKTTERKEDSLDEPASSPSPLVWLFVAVSVAGTVVLIVQSRRR